MKAPFSGVSSIAGLASALILALGLSSRASADEEKPVAYVPVPPYAFVLEKLAGDLIEVRTICNEGDDCHNYSPSPRQLARITKANFLFSGELGFEGGFFVAVGDGKSGPVPIDLLANLDLLEGSCDICLSTDGHTEGEAEEHADHHHDHEDLKDPHVWLSPSMLKQQAVTITSELKKHFGEEEGVVLDQNLAALTAELDEIDKELRETLASAKGSKFYVYHGAFAYFAADYGLEQVAIEIGNQKPTPKQLAKIATQAQEDDVTVVFVQPQFDQSSARSLASAIGGEVAELDPLSRDVFANLRSIAKAIAATAAGDQS
ncbi:MAG: zinc ABC transporter substrate-binding protein [Verrucomicrobiota bacterium]